MHNSIFSLSNIDFFSSFFYSSIKLQPLFSHFATIHFIDSENFALIPGKKMLSTFFLFLPQNKKGKKIKQKAKNVCMQCSVDARQKRWWSPTVSSVQEGAKRIQTKPGYSKQQKSSEPNKTETTHRAGGGWKRTRLFSFWFCWMETDIWQGGQRQMRLVYDTFRAASPHHLGVVLCLEFSPIFCLVAFINFCEQEIKMLVLWVRWMAGVWQWFGLKKKVRKDDIWKYFGDCDWTTFNLLD